MTTLSYQHRRNESLMRTSKSIGSAGDSIESRESIDVPLHHREDADESTITRAKSPFAIQLVQECSAIHKGLLWERQQNRFFFNRWKARFFVLTTDYLTCFKRGSKKVGMSEMGSFVYKINLGDIKALSWADKKKNGAIGLHLPNTVLFLWLDSGRELDQWMIALQEASDRTKVRRETMRKSATLLPNMMMLTNSPSRLTPLQRTDVNLLNPVHHSPSHHYRGDTPDIAPPPPPPRRYLRCLSTDLDTSHGVGASPRTTLRTMRDRSASPGIATLQKQFEYDRKSSISSAASSLRLKPPPSSVTMSPLLLSNSPTLLAQHQQRRSTAKRLSTLGSSRPTSQFQAHSHFQFQQQQQQQQQQQSHYQAAESANSEFAFIPIRPPSGALNHVDLTRSFDLEASRAPRVPAHRSSGRSGVHYQSNLTSSASLMLPGRRAAFPPEVPAHRSSGGGADFSDRPLPSPPVEHPATVRQLHSSTLQYPSAHHHPLSQHHQHQQTAAITQQHHHQQQFQQSSFPPVPPHRTHLHNF